MFVRTMTFCISMCESALFTEEKECRKSEAKRNSRPRGELSRFQIKRVTTDHSS